MTAKKYPQSLCWIRRDLRLSDHRALSEATRNSEKVGVVFVFDSTILDQLADRDDRRVSFIHQSLQELDEKLQAQGSKLIVLQGDPVKLIPQLAIRWKAQAVFTNRDYEPQAKDRDLSVENALQKNRIAFHSFKDQVIFERREILSGSGTPFRVFTPYKNTWLKRLHEDLDEIQEQTPDLSKLAARKTLEPWLQPWELRDLGFQKSTLWLEPGESAAHSRLKNFMRRIENYANQRDFPAADGTSGLSVHLRFGTLSIRHLVRAALSAPSKGSDTWLSELVWRDFYQMILDQFSHVVGHAFKQEYDAISWPGSEKHFELWCQGLTGYPLVDAAMRHFNATGWMHNRLRMIVASFLTKDLLVDWRKGEAYFARKLLDFDLAANNGGWQWSASTGCDAQPYFRIFNPITQSEKFDAEGEFIRSQIPELRGLSSKDIHFPQGLARNYPEPIVDHSQQREKALQLFGKLKK